ncbi:Alkyl sulfatase [Lachancea thermotolerans]
MHQYWNTTKPDKDCSSHKPPKTAHPVTVNANEAVARRLPFSDTRDFDDATKGFIGTIPDAVVLNQNGQQVWSMKKYDFLQTSRSPDTVNPSLWRMARLQCNSWTL